jgi:hypothetical protein
VGASEHDGAFHGGENKCGYGFQIEALRDAMAGLLETLFDGGGPIVEGVSDALVKVTLAVVNFEGELADETATGEFAIEEIAAVDIENGEDAIDGIGYFFEDGIDGGGNEEASVVVKNGEEHVFFGAEEVVETAGVGFGALEDLVDGGEAIAVEPEETAGGFDDATASGFASW